MSVVGNLRLLCTESKCSENDFTIEIHGKQGIKRIGIIIGITARVMLLYV